MILRNFKTSEPILNKHGIQAVRLYDQTEAQIIHMSLEPGEALQPHITPVNVVFYILEGEAVIEVGAEQTICHSDDLIESPKDIPHCIYNKTNKITRLLVMKMPRP